MSHYIIKCIISAIPVLIGTTFLVFTIMDLAPGDPTRTILDSNTTEAVLASLRDSMGLNDPSLVRYERFILGLLHGDSDTSYRNGQAVLSLIMECPGNAVVLAISRVVFSAIIGIPTGVISAIKQYSVLDNIAIFITLFLMTAPTFQLALIPVITFSPNPGWLSSSDIQHGFPDSLISLILPTLTLGCGYAVLIIRTTRSSILEVVYQDYIGTARAKGLAENAAIWKHILKNALVPIVIVVGPSPGTLSGSSVLAESVFSWPGVGRSVVNSIPYKDMPAVLGNMMTLVILFTVVNLIIDLLYAFLDPRIKPEYQSSWKRTKKK